MRNRILSSLVAGGLILPLALASADEQAAAEKDKEKVKTGVIAGSVKSSQFGAIDVETSGASPGDEISVISGSVSHRGREDCVVVVANASPKNEYSVSFTIEGTDGRGTKVLSKSFSATVPAKGSVEKTVACRPDYNMQVVLKSAKKR